MKPLTQIGSSIYCRAVARATNEAEVGLGKAGGRRERWWIRVQNALTVAALGAGPLFAHEWMPWLQIVVGAVLFVAGGVIGIAGVRALGRNRTPHPAPLPEGDLVQTGIYSRVRHPLYTSLMLVTFGWSLGWGSVAGLVFSGCLAWWLERKARLEEQYMVAHFPEYKDYANRVRRFFPGVY